ncbi:MAG: neutral/alkaline non-lysosomal ceramidase N-terminal domain-containing protein [Planctomycetota bacterium]
MLPRAAAPFVLILMCCPALVAQGRAAEAATFRAGAAVVDITPREFPISMLGSFSDRQATSAHDPLEVRAILLDDGRTRIAIAVCDNCVIPRELLDQAKQLANEQTGIPTERILIAATHTHTAPAVVVLSDIPVDSQYTKLLVAGIAEAIAGAASRLEPARIGWSVVSVPEEVFNRRWFMKEGAIPPNPFGKVDKVRTNPPGASADLIRPAGPTDPDVSVLSVQTAAGKPLALLAKYSLHYVGGIPSGQVSADYFGEFARLIHERLAPGSEFVGVLTNGTSGDINNINFRQPRKRGEPFSQIRAVAGRVAEAAEQAYQGIEHREQITLAMAEREISVGVRKPNAEELARARAIVAESDDKGLPGLARYYAQSSVRVSEFPDTVKIKLQALRIGRLGMVTIPCEVFAEIGLEIKRRSPLQPSFTIQLANGYNGYLPSPEQHALGGYETWRATSSYLEVEASRKITSTLLELLAEVSENAPDDRAESTGSGPKRPSYVMHRTASGR